MLLVLLCTVLLTACDGVSGGATAVDTDASASAETANGSTEAPRQLGMCASCHGVNGIASLPGYPHLAGQDRTYLRVALLQYKSGARIHAPMQAVVGVLGEDDLDALALWYAQQPRDGGQR